MHRAFFAQRWSFKQSPPDMEWLREKGEIIETEGTHRASERKRTDQEKKTKEETKRSD